MKTALRTPPVKPEKESPALRFLYNNAAGRCILRLLRARWLSAAAGAFLDTRLSKPLIKPFVKNNGIDLSEYESDNFTCFNDCFCRKIKPGMRDLKTEDAGALISPCDGLLSVYKAENCAVYPVKQSAYTLQSLLCNDALAGEYENGYVLVFRLCVNHYHRYCYPASGTKGENVKINGTLHTVRPIALAATKVFCENSREYTVIETDRFGKIVQMEVGAMLVGKIKNHHGAGPVEKGAEKGMFLYGGSTVILLVKQNAAAIRVEYIKNTENGFETPVKQGDIINE